MQTPSRSNRRTASVMLSASRASSRRLWSISCIRRLRPDRIAATGRPIRKAAAMKPCSTTISALSECWIRLIGPSSSEVKTVAMLATLVTEKAVPSAPSRNAWESTTSPVRNSRGNSVCAKTATVMVVPTSVSRDHSIASRREGQRRRRHESMMMSDAGAMMIMPRPSVTAHFSHKTMEAGPSPPRIAIARVAEAKGATIAAAPTKRDNCPISSMSGRIPQNRRDR